MKNKGRKTTRGFALVVFGVLLYFNSSSKYQNIDLITLRWLKMTDKNDQALIKIYFHWSGGKNRTGTGAIGTLLSLGEAKTKEEAEKMVTEIRA
ncbi:hypothetical protein [Alkalihalobacillus deserti]|uniref:hypothetical protein n=1 Tax=Alkalihalobacillus deserti TaxID=2879466 RepID=UPI001D144DF9|nr:hypothetical protein [Alkalihalobacillus deserti]